MEFLKPFQAKRAQFAADMGEVEDILKKSEEKARVLADAVLKEIKEKIGLL